LEGRAPPTEHVGTIKLRADAPLAHEPRDLGQVHDPSSYYGASWLDDPEPQANTIVARHIEPILNAWITLGHANPDCTIGIGRSKCAVQAALPGTEVNCIIEGIHELDTPILCI
jgi:hypothetical protein